MTSDEKDNYRLNMTETIENVFRALFDDESWTWSGLATLLVDRFGTSDLEELDACLQIAKEKQAAGVVV